LLVQGAIEVELAKSYLERNLPRDLAKARRILGVESCSSSFGKIGKRTVESYSDV